MKRAAAIDLLSRLKQQAEDTLDGLRDSDDHAAIYRAWRKQAGDALERGFGADSPTTETLFPASEAASIVDCEDAGAAMACARGLLEQDIEWIKLKRKAIVNSVGDNVE